MRRIINILLISGLLLSLIGCATVNRKGAKTVMTPAVASELQYGKRLFNEGYYRRAMRELLPLACDGNAEAQYAVGYMHYYGLGTTQDTEIGYFWIRRAASQHYRPAMVALEMIETNSTPQTP